MSDLSGLFLRRTQTWSQVEGQRPDIECGESVRTKTLIIHFLIQYCRKVRDLDCKSCHQQRRRLLCSRHYVEWDVTRPQWRPSDCLGGDIQHPRVSIAPTHCPHTSLQVTAFSGEEQGWMAVRCGRKPLHATNIALYRLTPEMLTVYLYRNLIIGIRNNL